MCRNSPKILIGVHGTESKCLFVPAHCGTWDCHDCAPKIRAQHQARIIHATETLSGRWSFITVTAHRKWRGFEKSLANLQANSRKLLERIRRKYGTCHYVIIHEPHQDGSLHFHALYNCVIETNWLKDASAACGMGYQCKSEVLRDAKASGKYVSKYLAKSVGEDGIEDGEEPEAVLQRDRVRSKLPKKFKRVRYSQGFPALPEHPEQGEYDWSAAQWEQAAMLLKVAEKKFDHVVNLIERERFS